MSKRPHVLTSVVDSRLTHSLSHVGVNRAIRRRRECAACKERWTTYEIYDSEMVGALTSAAELSDRMKSAVAVVKTALMLLTNESEAQRGPGGKGYKLNSRATEAERTGVHKPAKPSGKGHEEEGQGDP